MFENYRQLKFKAEGKSILPRNQWGVRGQKAFENGLFLSVIAQGSDFGSADYYSRAVDRIEKRIHEVHVGVPEEAFKEAGYDVTREKGGSGVLLNTTLLLRN